MSQQENNNMGKHFYRASAADFKKIPGEPLVYWLSTNHLSAFENGLPLHSIAKPVVGLQTGDNESFIRLWQEVNIKRIGFNITNRDESKKSGFKWFPYTKGGDFRKWYGNNYWVVDWEDDGKRICQHQGAYPRNKDKYFSRGLTYTNISSGSFAARHTDQGFIFDQKGSMFFDEIVNGTQIAACLLHSSCGTSLLKAMCPTLDFNPGTLANLPILNIETNKVKSIFEKSVEITRRDWDSYEISWDFRTLPLLNASYHQPILSEAYQQLRFHWCQTTQKMQRLEEENNLLFINTYGLQDELTPEVPLKEITLTCNPRYRYGNNKTDEELNVLQQSDSLAELISYIIGCMMGRYSLDREGLVYAHAGNEGFKKLVEGGVYASFPADSDGILPLTSEAWFKDDITARVEEFVHTVWGNKHLEENLKFIADSLCLAAIQPVKKGGETSRETIRRYLSTQFFKDHLKAYKKRPIYWLFSSGKEKAFECLVYLHRYNETTLPRMRTEYVTPLLGQMDSRIERLRLQQNEAETAEAKRIGKEIDSLTKQLTELRSFDDQLKHYADMKIQLDLDDGVKVNYGKFGTLLAEAKAITGDKAE